MSGSTTEAKRPQPKPRPQSINRRIAPGDGRFPAVCRSTREQTSDPLLHRFRRGAGVGGGADRPADDDVVGAGEERIFHVDRPLLIVCRAVNARADAGDDDDELVAQLAADGLDFQPRRDNPVAAQRQRQRPPRPAEDDGADVGLKTECLHVTLVEAGQHGDGENAERPLLGAGGFEDRIVAVNGGERCPALRQLADGGADRLRHVEELEVDEDLLALVGQPVEELKIAACHEQLEANLVEGDRRAEPGDEVPRLVGAWDVEGEDQPVGRRDRLGREERAVAGHRLTTRRASALALAAGRRTDGCAGASPPGARPRRCWRESGSRIRWRR